MADKTAIEWTDATWNPIVGCSVVSPGCKHCYAMPTAFRHALMAAGSGQVSAYAGLTQPSKAGPVWTGEVRLVEARLDQPLRWSRPRMIFVNSMGDLFHEDVPDAWIDRVFAVMALAPRHTFQVLTKRSARMREYLCRRAGDYEVVLPEAARAVGTTLSGCAAARRVTWPLPNVWLGVSAEDQPRADERVPDLLATPAAVRWVSAEPLLGPIDLTRIQAPRFVPEDHETDWKFDSLSRGSSYECIDDLGFWMDADGPDREAVVDWVVAGGESGPGARPMHPDWARGLRDQCAHAGVAFYFKQWGEHAWAERLAGHPSTLTAYRAGKKAAGRSLDGRTHDAFPEAARA